MITAEEMSTLHGRAFDGHGRAWSTSEFAALVDDPNIIICGDTRAFALGRFAADEAELLTIATDPDYRRRGLAKAVLNMLEARVIQKGAARLFLEVAAENMAARALYSSAGYSEIARRPDYYKIADRRVDAIVCEKQFSS